MTPILGVIKCKEKTGDICEGHVVHVGREGTCVVRLNVNPPSVLLATYPFLPDTNILLLSTTDTSYY